MSTKCQSTKCQNLKTFLGPVSGQPYTIVCKHLLLSGERECACCAEHRIGRHYDHAARGMCSGRDDRPEDRAYTGKWLS